MGTVNRTTAGGLQPYADLGGNVLMPLTGIGSGETHIGAVGGLITKVSVEVTGHAGAGAYHANDVISVPTEIPNLMRIVGGQCYVTEVRVAANIKSIIPRFRVHFFNAANPTVSADGANMLELYADTAKRMGYLDTPSMQTAALTASSDMSRAILAVSPAKPLVAAPATASVWVLIETLDGFTPADTGVYTIVIAVEAY